MQLIIAFGHVSEADRSLSPVMSSGNSVTTAAVTAACARLSAWYLKCLVVSATQLSQNELATSGFAGFSRYLSTLRISNIKEQFI